MRVTFGGSFVVDTEAGVVGVDARTVGEALHGDHVLVEVRSLAARGFMRGSLQRILERPPQRLTGVLDPARGFVADDARFPRPLRCAMPRSLGASTELYGAELLAQPTERGPEVRLVCRLGERAVAADEREAMLWREQVEEGFPRAALEEARAESRRPHVPSARHEDLRELPFVTIDPPDAEDYDDALFAERLRGGRVRCCVAIADVASLMAQGGPLDLEARERGATLYIPGHLIPMLPRCISTDAASLMPGRDRRAVVLDVILDEAGRIQKRRLRLGVIRSRERLSYDEAADLLYDVASAHPDVRAFAPMVRLLDEVACTLRERRARRGALQVETPSVRVDVSEDGEPVRMRQVGSDRWRKRACGLVEELMLLANEAVAEMLEAVGMDAFCRSHAAPPELDVARIRATAERHRVHLTPAVLGDARALQQRVHAMADSTAKDALRAALLDAMPAATYTRGRQEHFALATSNYVHFTSPIRRYPDVLVHRAVHALVLNRPDELEEVDLEALNEAQQRARRIHYEITSLYGALVASEFVGAPLLGTVTRVSQREVFVLVDEPAITIRCRLDHDVVHGARVVVVPEAVDVSRRAVHGRLRGYAKTAAG